jgi:hypothetical protein
MRRALDPRVNEIPRQTLYDIAGRFAAPEDNPFLWREPTAMTPIHGRLASAYLAINERAAIPVTLFVVGLGVAVWRVVRQRNILWLAVIVYLFYTAVVPFLVVPAAPRHRLPADMVADVVVALAIVHAACLAARLWPAVTAWSAAGRRAISTGTGGSDRGFAAVAVLGGALAAAFLMLALAL